MIKYRLENQKDFKTVENITREAFWNLNSPGCVEHYLTHIMRNHVDFVPELDFVAELDGKIIGNIMFTKASIVTDNNEVFPILTFGPIAVLPEYQKIGVGKGLINHAIKFIDKTKYRAIIIYGNPFYYCNRSFYSAKDYNISTVEGTYPTAMLVRELYADSLKGIKGKYYDSDVYHNIKDEDVDEFDKSFKPKEKQYESTQTAFSIIVRSTI